MIEEIGRLYGYVHLPLTLPRSNKQKIRRKIIDTLVGLGLNENINYGLVSEEENQLFSIIHEKESNDVELLMPLSVERKVLRKSLMPSLIASCKYSYNRKMKDLSIFEIGRVYYKQEEFVEEEHLGLYLLMIIQNR